MHKNFYITGTAANSLLVGPGFNCELDWDKVVDKLNEMCDEIEDAESDRDYYDDEISGLEMAIEDLEDQIDDLIQTNNELEDEIDELKNQSKSRPSM